MQTDDGGATWRTTGTPGFYLGSVFSVSGPDVLWSGTQGDAGPVERPVLDVSRDGGRTWADARLPGLVGSQYAANTVLAPPAWFGATGVELSDAGHGVALVATGAFTTPSDLFVTVDGGTTWTAASTN